MSMFDLSKVEEKGNGGNGNLYIYPGIREVEIVKWSKGESAQGKPKITVELITLEGKEAGNDASKEFDFYVSDKAMDMSLRKIKHMATKVTTEANFASKNPADMEEMVDHLNDISRKGKLRMKFTGEEYLNSNGEKKVAARIGLPEFAEAIEEGAEYPVVTETKLVYDENNQYDLKKLQEPTPEEGVNAGSGSAVNW